MKTLARLLGFFSLAVLILPPFAYMLQLTQNLGLVKGLMLGATALWFLTAPLWMKHDEG